MEEINKLETSIPSSYSNLHLVERFIEQIIATFEMPEKVQSDLMLALVEVSYNALLPDPRETVQKFAKFTAVKNRRKIVVTIEESGNGFDYTHPPCPLSKEREGLTGRSIYVMAALTDELRFIDKGRKIVMSFALDR